MKNERETKAKLLASAKQEFTEKGYMQASLREICKKAGVTTGALYFFFQDKEDLFASLVEEPLNRLYEVMQDHYSLELQLAEDGKIAKTDFSEDLHTAGQVIHYMYQYYEEFQLILMKGQGSRFEHCIDQFADLTGEHYRVLADKFSALSGKARIDDYMIHWISHMTIDIFVHMLTHETSEETALHQVETMIKYAISGWFGMFQ